MTCARCGKDFESDAHADAHICPVLTRDKARHAYREWLDRRSQQDFDRTYLAILTARHEGSDTDLATELVFMADDIRTELRESTSNTPTTTEESE